LADGEQQIVVVFPNNQLVQVNKVCCGIQGYRYLCAWLAIMNATRKGQGKQK
jgi:hypothetical protein